MTTLDSSSESEKKGSIFNSSWNQSDTPEEASFHGVSAVSVIALIAGILSPLYFLDKSFFFIPVAATLLAIWALWSIKKSGGTLIGENLARVAFFLAIVSVVGTTANDSIVKSMAVRQAKQFFPLVFKAMREGDALTLHQMTLERTSRGVVDEKQYWMKEVNNEDHHPNLHISFLEHELLLTMAGLGDSAKVTYYKTNNFGHFPEDGKDAVVLTYAVTYPSPKDGKPETFLIKMNGIRARFEDGTCGWSIPSYPLLESSKNNRSSL